MKVTINDKTIDVPQGTTILLAAQQAGVEIPTLCNHPNLTPYGGCRLCLVEVQGARTLQPSCTLPASEGMVVKTESEKISQARKFVLTLIFSERNHFCPYCQVSGGDCELQNAALKEGMTHWPLPPNWNQYPVDASHKYFVVDHNRCILCRRCVRACAELSGNFTLGLEERGARSFLVADLGIPMGDSSCISCGSCTQVCPTGAIIDRVSAYRGKVVDVEHHNSICIGCSVGCGVDVLTRDNRLVRIEGDWNAPVNGGVICKQGRFEPLSDERVRLTRPMVRRNGSLQPATWAEAMAEVEKHLKPLAGKNGSGVAALASTRLSLEALHTFKQIFKGGLATSIEEGATTALPGQVAASLGRPFEGTLGDIEICDMALVIGANLVDNHEVAGFFIKRGMPHGLKLVTVDPGNNPLEPLAHLVMHPKAGSDVEVIKGLTSTLKGQTGTLGQVTEKSGVPAKDIQDAAELLAKAKHPVIVYGKGITTQSSPEALVALVELAEAGKAKLVGTRGEANSLAALLYGLDKPFIIEQQLAAFIALGDEIPSQRLIKKLDKSLFLVVQAAYASQLTGMASVVLPVTDWTEQEGHYLNLEGRLQKAVKVLEPEEGIPSNQAALEELATRLGVKLDDGWKSALLETVSPAALQI